MVGQIPHRNIYMKEYDNLDEVLPELPEQADGLLIAKIYRMGDKTIHAIQTFDRLNENKPLNKESLKGIAAVINKITEDTEEPTCH